MRLRPFSRPRPVGSLGSYATGRSATSWPPCGRRTSHCSVRKSVRRREGEGDGPRFGSSLCRRSCRSEEHTSELQSRQYLVCRLLLEKKKNNKISYNEYLIRSDLKIISYSK